MAKTLSKIIANKSLLVALKFFDNDEQVAKYWGKLFCLLVVIIKIFNTMIYDPQDSYMGLSHPLWFCISFTPLFPTFFKLMPIIFKPLFIEITFFSCNMHVCVSTPKAIMWYWTCITSWISSKCSEAILCMGIVLVMKWVMTESHYGNTIRVINFTVRVILMVVH